MSVFPGAIATDANLYIAVNNLATTLSNNPLSAGATTVNVPTTANFPANGLISIELEVIAYASKTATTFTGCTRGFDGTAAVQHTFEKPVALNIVAAHHNVLKDEIKALEVTASNYVTVKDFGAKGDGSTDDTVAIQAAIDSGKSVFFPKTSTFYKITSTLNVSNSNQRLFGEGSLSTIQQFGTNANSSVFFVGTKSNIIFDGLHVIPGTTTNNTVYGYGFTIQSSTYCKVINCVVTGHRRGGIFFQTSNYCQAIGNLIHNSVVNSGTDDHTQAGTDIFIGYGGSDNIVANNTIITGCGTGIGIETLSNSVDSLRNIIANNVVNGEGIYGILVYVGVAGGLIQKTVVSGNTVGNITGAIQNDSTGQHPFGAGVYIQNAEYTVIIGNNISDTNSSTDIDQLAPGGIGTTNCTNALISSNQIRNTGSWHGITVRDPNTQGTTTGFAEVVNNNIYNTAIGIQILERGRVKVASNTIDTVSSGGIIISNTVTKRPGITILSNSLKNITGSGIVAVFCTGIIINGNDVFGQTGYGVILNGSVDDATISNNLLRNGSNLGGSAGIDVESTGSTGCLISGNYITTNAFGVILNAVCKFVGNFVSGNTSNAVFGSTPVPGPSKALATDSVAGIVASTTTDVELGYVSGVTSSIQTQLNSKATDSGLVHTTGNETIAGFKTFTSELIVAPGTSTGTDYQIFQGNGGGLDNFQIHQYRQTGVSTTATQIASITDFSSIVMVVGFDGTAARFFDTVICSFGTATPVTLTSLTTAGSPATRTYSIVGNSQLKLAMGSGTYSINTSALLTQSN